MTPKVDNKRPKSVQVIKSTTTIRNISSSRSSGNEKTNDKREESPCNYLVILQNLKQDGSLSTSLQDEVKKDIFCESKPFQDSSDNSITLTGTVDQVKGQEIETYVTFPTKDESEQAIICEFSESDDTPVTRGIETCIGEQNCEHSTFYPDEQKPRSLLYDKQFSLNSITSEHDSSTYKPEKDIKCQKEENIKRTEATFRKNEIFFDEVNLDETEIKCQYEENPIKMNEPLSINETYSVEDDLLKNEVATDNASSKEEIVIEENCTVHLSSGSDEFNEKDEPNGHLTDDDKSEQESDDDRFDHESNASLSSDSEVDTSCYVNYPDDLRPSHRLPQRLTSRRSTTLLPPSLLCTGADLGHDWSLEQDKRGHGGCWSWLSRF